MTKAYTVKDIDLLRGAVIELACAQGSVSHASQMNDLVLESKVRTYMEAGLTADDLLARAEEVKQERMDEKREATERARYNAKYVDEFNAFASSIDRIIR